MNYENLTLQQKLHITIHRDVRIIAKECCHLMGLEIQKEAMELIAELIYKKLFTYGLDLEAFAKHAKRNTIMPEDVKLIVRNNPSLKEKVSDLIEKQIGPPKRRKAATSTTNNSSKLVTEMPASTSKQTKHGLNENDQTVKKMDVTVDLTFDDDF